MASKQGVLVAAVAMLGCGLFATRAAAVPITFEPLTTTVFEGDTVDVGIRVSRLEAAGADEIVGGFDLDILFDNSILTATNFTFGPGFDDPLFASANFAPGVADVASFSLETDDDLAAAQGDSVLLGLLRFVAVGIGQTLLGFDLDPLFGSNIVGRNFSSLPFEPSVGQVTVIARPVQVPEPPTALLFASAALLLLVARFRRRPSAQHSTPPV